MTILDTLFSGGGYMPHGHCYLWQPGLVWLHVISDTLVGLAYLSIPVTIFYFVRKRRDLPFNWMFLMFGFFIVSCGLTHFMEVWTLWHPLYWLSGCIKAVTAAASLATALLLVPVVPRALALPSPDVLRQLNERLSQEVAERKKKEDEAARANVELEAANKELEAFSYSVSHDLRAPLRAIEGFSRMLVEDCSDRLDGQGRHYLERVQANTRHMGQLIDDLLVLSRLTRKEMQIGAVDLSALAHSIAAELQAAQPERAAHFVIAPGARVQGDANLLRAALENLLGNAWKYTSKHPCAHIEFGIREADGQTIYFVRDDGAGFDPAFADKLFGAFQRLHSSAEFEGTGVGLATVQRIIRRHGGRIWAQGGVEQGATFSFTCGGGTPR